METEIKNESLEDAATKYASSKYDKNMTSILDAWKLKESTLWDKSKRFFEDGAKWQKEKDKIIIERLKADNEVLLNGLKEIIDLFPENPKLPISYQVLGVANEALSKTNNLFRKEDIEAIKQAENK